MANTSSWQSASIDVEPTAVETPAPPPQPVKAEERGRAPGGADARVIRNSGLTETSGITLTLLDVEVVDRKGKPIPGLKKEDFQVFLDWREWPIYSVDDLCACEETGTENLQGKGAHGEAAGGNQAPRAAGAPTGTAPTESSGAGAAPGPSQMDDPLRYVLYFDFSELAVDGRGRALGAAKEWIRTTKQPQDQVMIAGYATVSGLRELSTFTSSAQELLGALDKASGDPTLQDSFPSLLSVRQEECVNALKNDCPLLPDCSVCSSLARDEYRQGLYSMRALKTFLQGLEQAPGRKALLFFQTNGVLRPAFLYPATDPVQVGDHLRLLDEVGAEAMLSRTTVYPANTGDADLSEESGIFSSNLADLTGGTFNRNFYDLSTLLKQAGRAGCSCIYRVGLKPPKRPTSHIYAARVQVRDQRIPYSYRVQFLDDVDRWLRRAVAILRNPERAHDLEVGAALIPLKASGRFWDVAVQVGLDLDSLEMTPASGGAHGSSSWQGSWEAGALLSREDGTRNWEMLGLSSLQREREGKTEESVLHEHRFSGLSPGRYRLAAFVRDQTAAVFGGAETVLDLPAPGGDATVGPFILRERRRRLVVPLPILQKKSTHDSHASVVETGPMPLLRELPNVGEDLEALTWICPKGAPPSPAELQRYISLNGVPVFRLEAAVVEPAGVCVRIADRLPTRDLKAGTYTYQLRWRGNRKKTARVSVSADFTLESRPAAPPVAPAPANAAPVAPPSSSP